MAKWKSLLFTGVLSLLAYTMVPVTGNSSPGVVPEAYASCRTDCVYVGCTMGTKEACTLHICSDGTMITCYKYFESSGSGGGPDREGN